GEFARDGLTSGEPVVIVAAETHASGLASAIAQRGFDVERERAAGRLTIVDARAALETFMADGMPDVDRFHRAAQRLLSPASALANGRSVRAYGEMVDLLWRDGNTNAALRLEELWNGLVESNAFTVLCTYDMGTFRDAGHTEALDRICKAHTTVRPTETFLER